MSRRVNLNVSGYRLILTRLTFLKCDHKTEILH